MRWILLFWVGLVSFPAWAGVTLVAMPPLVADGVTTGTVRLYIDDGARPKIKVDTGKMGPVVIGADGVVTFPYTPARANAPAKIPFRVTLASVESTVEVSVVPPFGGDVSLTFDPPVLTTTGAATVKITPSQAGPVSADRRQFLISASTGTVTAPAPTGDGTWIARYTPPKGLAVPTPVVFAVADASAPTVVNGYAVLPITVRKSITLDAPAGSSNVLYLGDRQYGPMVAAPTGKVAFDVDLDPRRPTGRLATVAADGARSDTDIPLPDAPKAVVSWLATPPAIPAGAPVFPVRLLVLGPDGASKLNADIKVAVSAGSVTEAKQVGDLYEVLYTPPNTAGEVVFSAESEGIRGERKVKLLPSLGSATLVTEPAELAKGATTFKVTARVKDGAGTAVIGRAPVITTTTGTVGTVKDMKDGSYTATVTVPSSTTFARVYASPALDASGQAPTRLIAWPSASAVAANGTDQVTVTVMAVDGYGLPVPNIDLKLGVPLGDGSLPPTAKTDARGAARVTYKAGQQAGLGTIRVEGAGLIAEAPIFQVASGMAPAVPVGGPPDVEAILAKLQGATPSAVVTRAGTAPLSGPPAVVQIATVPPYTTPGAAILVTVRVADVAGKGVGAQKLAITASPGTPGAITDNRDGTYTFPLQLAAGQDGPVTVNVGAGSATGAIVLPRLQDAAAAMPQATARTGGAAGGGGGNVAGGGGGAARVSQAGSATEAAKLRVGVVFTNAHGSFAQTGNGGEQLLGKAEYATPGAGFMGLHADLVAWPLTASWGSLGVDARVNGQLELFQVLANPYLNVPFDISGSARYGWNVGPARLGGGLGVHYLSGTLFRYKDSTLTEAALLHYPVIGARLAPSVQVDTGKVYVLAEFAETFVPFPVNTRIEGQFEYDFGPAGLRAGIAWEHRSMRYETANGMGKARVKQTHTTVLLGTGFSF